MYNDPNASSSPKLLKIIIGLLCLLVVIAAASAYYFYDQNQKARAATVAAKVDKEDEYIDRVSALVVVPAGEEPVVAAIDDKSKFAGQQFFSMAQNGDVFVIYPKAKRAYLYRPSVNKIVDVGPVDNKTALNQSTPSATPNSGVSN